MKALSCRVQAGLLLILSIALSSPVFSASEDAASNTTSDAILDAWSSLLKHLSSMNALDASFKQVTFVQSASADSLATGNSGTAKLEKLQTLKGHLSYLAPNQFLWETHEPYEQQLVSDGKQIWHYDVDLEQVVIQDFAEQAQQALLLSVLQQPDSLRDSFALIDADNTRYRLKALSASQSIQKVSLVFTKADSEYLLSEFSFEDVLGQLTEIKLKNSNKKSELSVDSFKFVLPEGVDVIYE